ncbi:hypothetical protein RTP6_000609 [Batrachochytrium dendrobatidis]
MSNHTGSMPINAAAGFQQKQQRLLQQQMNMQPQPQTQLLQQQQMLQQLQSLQSMGLTPLQIQAVIQQQQQQLHQQMQQAQQNQQQMYSQLQPAVSLPSLHQQQSLYSNNRSASPVESANSAGINMAATTPTNTSTVVNTSRIGSISNLAPVAQKQTLDQLVSMQQLKNGQADTAVMIPQVNHNIVQSILDINKQLIRILVEYQNNGWIGEPEQKIYQQRLQTNLTYLATLADAVQKNKPAALAGQTPDISQVDYPSKLAHLQPGQANTAQSIKSDADLAKGVKQENAQGPLSSKVSTNLPALSEPDIELDNAKPTQSIQHKRHSVHEPQSMPLTTPAMTPINPAVPIISNLPQLQPVLSEAPTSLQPYVVTVAEMKALPLDRDTLIESVAPPVLILDPNHGSSKPDPSTYIPVPPFLGDSNDSMTNPTKTLPGFSVLDANAARDILRQRLSAPGDSGRGVGKSNLGVVDIEGEYRDSDVGGLRDGGVYANVVSNTDTITTCGEFPNATRTISHAMNVEATSAFEVDATPVPVDPVSNTREHILMPSSTVVSSMPIPTPSNLPSHIKQALLPSITDAVRVQRNHTSGETTNQGAPDEEEDDDDYIPEQHDVEEDEEEDGEDNDDMLATDGVEDDACTDHRANDSKPSLFSDEDVFFQHEQSLSQLSQQPDYSNTRHHLQFDLVESQSNTTGMAAPSRPATHSDPKLAMQTNAFVYGNSDSGEIVSAAVGPDNQSKATSQDFETQAAQASFDIFGGETDWGK